MRSWFKFGHAWFAAAGSCAPFERWPRSVYAKRYAVLIEMAICLSLLPDAIRAQICAFMSLWSKAEITATAPICLHTWQLYLLTFSGTFASYNWFMAAIKPIKGSGQIFILLEEWGQSCLFSSLSDQVVWITGFHTLAHPHTYRQCAISDSLASSQRWCDGTYQHVTEKLQRQS